VPQIEPDNDISKETLIGEKPDLVIAHGYTNAPQDQLEAVGIKSMTVNVCCDSYAKAHGGQGSFDEIYDDITMLGTLLGTESYAAKSVASMKASLAKVAREAPALRKHLSDPTAAVAYFYQGGFYTYGRPSMGDAQLRALGLENVFGNLKARGTQLNGEEFIAKNPGLIVIATGFKKGETQEDVLRRVLKVPGIKRMTAIRRHHVVVLPGGMVLARAFEGVQRIAAAMGTFT
jgi:iron complex transport system substrate-binding protein